MPSKVRTAKASNDTTYERWREDVLWDIHQLTRRDADYYMHKYFETLDRISWTHGGAFLRFALVAMISGLFGWAIGASK